MKHGKGTYACGKLALRASCVTCEIKSSTQKTCSSDGRSLGH